MATYVVLNKLTDQGIRTIKETLNRVDAARETAKKFGITMKDVYWTMGAYDVVTIFEAPDDASMTAFGLVMGGMGNTRSESLRALTRDEMKNVLSKMAGTKEKVPA
jgi:uncharacterized protein with GYD domain